MSDKNEGLNDRLARKKRVQRMKTGLVWFLITWLLAQTLISITLIAKVHSLQEQIDIVTENTIRSQQVDQQENQTLNTGDSYDAVTGKNSNSTKAADMKTAGTAGKAAVNQLKLSAKNADRTSAGSDPAEDKQEQTQEENKKVYLTFDDGPSKNTNKILDILDEYHVKATFFLTGREDKKSLQLYREIIKRGHTVGKIGRAHV